MSLYIGVAGASRPAPPLLDQAEVLGRRLAEAGAVVVCGGGPGVMEAVCRGARSAGGTTVGLLPGLDRGEGNPHLSVAVPTGMGQGRNLLLVRSSDAMVAVGGGFGTLSEIALALRTGVPVVGLATWSLQLDAGPVDAFPVAGDAETAARLAIEAARSRQADPAARRETAEPGDPAWELAPFGASGCGGARRADARTLNLAILRRHRMAVLFLLLAFLLVVWSARPASRTPTRARPPSSTGRSASSARGSCWSWPRASASWWPCSCSSPSAPPGPGARGARS